MNVKFYKNKSDKIVVDKNIDQVGNTITSAVIKEDISIMDPVFLLRDFTSFNIATCNYCYIDDLNRYYYITDIVILDQNLYEIHCHVDVLMSFKDGIRSNSAIISRQQNSYDLYLADGVFKTKAYPKFDIMKFPNGFTNYHYVLSVAGA